MKPPRRALSMPPCVTDLLFNLIAYLFLIITMANFNVSKEQNEQMLKSFRPSIFGELSKQRQAAVNDTHMVIHLHFKENAEKDEENYDGLISVFWGKEEIKEISLEEFKKYINNRNFEETIVILRCDKRIRMGFHDKVLAECRKRGNLKIRQMVKIGTEQDKEGRR